jgi:mono/diheme cytochrome c family protein
MEDTAIRLKYVRGTERSHKVSNSFNLFKLTFSALLLVGPVNAQEATGKRDYMRACVSCHGASGRGNGPIADLMTVKVSDLTQLSISNDGTFPLHDVMMFIDGRSRIRAHGGEMPVWGQIFVQDAEDYVAQYEAEKVAERRVLALALYIESIQE